MYSSSWPRNKCRAICTSRFQHSCGMRGNCAPTLENTNSIIIQYIIYNICAATWHLTSDSPSLYFKNAKQTQNRTIFESSLFRLCTSMRTELFFLRPWFWHETRAFCSSCLTYLLKHWRCPYCENLWDTFQLLTQNSIKERFRQETQVRKSRSLRDKRWQNFNPRIKPFLKFQLLCMTAWTNFTDRTNMTNSGRTWSLNNMMLNWINSSADHSIWSFRPRRSRVRL